MSYKNQGNHENQEIAITTSTYVIDFESLRTSWSIAVSGFGGIETELSLATTMEIVAEIAKRMICSRKAAH